MECLWNRKILVSDITRRKQMWNCRISFRNSDMTLLLILKNYKNKGTFKNFSFFTLKTFTFANLTMPWSCNIYFFKLRPVPQTNATNKAVNALAVFVLILTLIYILFEQTCSSKTWCVYLNQQNPLYKAKGFSAWLVLLTKPFTALCLFLESWENGYSDPKYSFC